MKKFGFISAVIFAMLLAFGMTPAHADAKVSDSVQYVGMVDGSVKKVINGQVVPMVAAGTEVAHTPWTGTRFNSQYVCLQNNIGTNWNIADAASAFESGVNTYVINYRFPAWGDQPCNPGYLDSQTIVASTNRIVDGATCWTVYRGSASSTGRYLGTVVIAMNVDAPLGCDYTTQRKNNNISQAIGYSLGLDTFDSTSWTASIMNDHFYDSYNFAGADDRTSLYWRVRT